MSICLNNLNISAYQYQLATQDKFKVICEPLLKLGIKYFFYGKVFSNGRYLHFINDIDFTRTYLENVKDIGKILTEQIDNIKKDKLSYFFLDSIGKFSKKHDPVIHLFHDFNIWNSLIIYRGSSINFIEVYGFFGGSDNAFFPNFCLNNITFLHHFCDYFNEKAADLIDCHDQSKLGCFEQQFNFYHVSQEDLLAQKMEQFLQETLIKKRVLKTPEKDISLSKREIECLHYLSLGKSAKEIAKILDLSPRSIEFYFRNIKQKSGLKRGELLTYFAKSHPLSYIQTSFSL